jgi:hypothetical protein
LTSAESRRGLGDRDGEPVDPRGVAFGQGSHDLVAGPLVQVQVGVAGADRLRGQLDAVQHQVRSHAQEQGVLAAGGLALRAVGHDHRAAAGRRDDGQLAVRGERRAAAAGQAGRLHVLYQVAAPAVVGRAAVPGQVRAEVFGHPGDRRQQAGQPGRGGSTDPGRRGRLL